MATLKTNYKDDILDTSVNTQRKYRMVNNADGTISLEDVTVYTQNGDTFGASEVNQIHAAVNMVNESLTVDTTNLSEDFSLNGLLQYLAEKYYPLDNASLILLKNGVLNSDYKWNGVYRSGSSGGSAKLTENALVVSASSGAIYQYYTSVDVTIYSKIVVKLHVTEATSASFTVGLTSALQVAPNGAVIQADTTTSNEQTFEIDVTNVTGSWYFVLQAMNLAGYVSEIKFYE